MNKTYASGGTRTVTLTVTDNEGATGSQSQSVTVTAPSTGITLSVSMSKVRGITTATLDWSGAASSGDVYKNGSYLKSVSGTSTTDNLGRGGGSVTYRVCNAGTSIYSADVTVSY